MGNGKPEVLVDLSEAEELTREKKRIQALIDEIRSSNFVAREKGGFIKVSCNHKHTIGEFFSWEQETIFGRMASHTEYCALIR